MKGKKMSCPINLVDILTEWNWVYFTIAENEWKFFILYKIRISIQSKQRFRGDTRASTFIKKRKKEREKFRGGEKTNAMSLKSTRLNFASRSNRIDQTREAFLFQNHSSTVVMRVLLINKLLFFAYIMFILILQQYRNI
jgi:hypothetical protein